MAFSGSLPRSCRLPKHGKNKPSRILQDDLRIYIPESTNDWIIPQTDGPKGITVTPAWKMMAILSIHLKFLGMYLLSPNSSYRPNGAPPAVVSIQFSVFFFRFFPHPGEIGMHRTREGDLRGNKMSEFCGVAQVACLKTTVKNGGDLGKKGSDFWLQSWWLMNINQLVDPKGVRFESQAITWGGGNYPPTITYPTDFGKSGRSSTQRWKSVSEGIVLMEESWLTTWDRDNPVNNPPVVGSLSHYLWGFSNIPGGCLGKSSIICRVSCMLGGCLGFLNHQQYHPQPFQTPLSSNSW